MTPREQILQKLGLRTHPFWPSCDEQNRAIPEKVWEHSLDPREDPRLVHYYFDLYNWASSQLVGPLSSTGTFTSFPRRADLVDRGPVLILISSMAGGTGRTALTNLTLHTIYAVEPTQPLVVEVTCSSDNPQNVRDMAKAFITMAGIEGAINSAIEERLWKTYEREVGEVDTTKSKDAYYTSLFSQIRNTIAIAKWDRPIVFLLSGAQDYDTWTCIYNSCKALADYVISETRKPDSAETAVTLINSKNVAHIQAPPLDLVRAKDYVAGRLRFERLPTATPPQPDSLQPFTEDAVGFLYERGDKADKNAPNPTRGIGYLRDTFKQALNDLLDELEPMVAADPAALDKVDRQRLLITGDRMRRTRDKMNEGN